MLIIPALYLHRGRCVSWYKGTENDQKSVYHASLIKTAVRFEKEGAALLHVTDLDSATGGIMNEELFHGIRNAITIPIEIGGGVRSLEHIDALFKMGMDRVIVGVSARQLIPEALKKHGPEKIIFGLKARGSFVDSDSLPPESDEVLEIAKQVIDLGVRKIVYKDLEREGTLFHPNYDEIERLLYFMPEGIEIFSSGGVASLRDLQILAGLEPKGVLIGRALMEHKINLKEAVETYETASDRLTLLEISSALGTR